MWFTRDLLYGNKHCRVRHPLSMLGSEGSNTKVIINDRYQCQIHSFHRGCHYSSHTDTPEAYSGGKTPLDPLRVEIRWGKRFKKKKCLIDGFQDR